MKTLRTIFILGLVATLAGCSQYSNAPTSKAWHNLNARYNALWMARNGLKMAEDTLFVVRQENYALPLPVFTPIDTVAAKSVANVLDDVVKKASVVAERHSNSVYLDEAYLLIGKARLLRNELVNAGEVFKYVNTNAKSEEAKQWALVNLMRIYIEQKDLSTAQEVAGIFANNPPSIKEIATQFLLTQAYLQQKMGEQLLTAAFLEKALENFPKGERKARIHYLIGQLYEANQRPDLANSHYKQVLNNNPSYDLEFHTIVNQLSTNTLSSSGNANAAFEKMLLDRKNVSFQDKIYYKMGQLAAENKQYPEAIKHFTAAANLSAQPLQRAASYEAIATLYQTQLNQLSLAKTYFDSTLAFLPPTHGNFESLANKAASLQSFIEYQTVLTTEDSLQRLATLSPERQREIFEQALRQKEQLEAQELAAAAQAATVERKASGGFGGSIFATRWEVYDPLKQPQQRMEFERIWGNRRLEDDWRRRDRRGSGGGFSLRTETLTPQQLAEEERKAEEAKLAAENKAELAFKQAIEKQLAAVPTTEQQLLASKKRQEAALFHLGKLQKWQYNNQEEAKRLFQRLLTDFPNSMYAPEALYSMSLLDANPSNNSYRTRLLQNFPATTFARQLARGKVEVTSESERLANDLYKQAFQYYTTGDYAATLAATEKGLTEHLGSQIEDKFAYLRILALAKGTELMTYRIAVEDFISSYPSSALGANVQAFKLALDKKTN